MSRLSRDVIGSVGISFTFAGLSLAIAVLLARILGAEGYGTYAFAWAFVTLLALPVQAGLPMLVVRETARGMTAGQPGLASGIWSWSLRTALFVSAVVAVGGLAVLLAVYPRPLGQQAQTIAWALALIPLIALGNIRGAALRGLGQVMAGQMPDLVVRPLALFGLLAGMTLAAGGLTPQLAMALHVAAAVVAVLFGMALLARNVPPQVRAATPVYRSRQWLASTLPLALMAGMLVVNQNTDVLMLGLFRPTDEVGVYRVAAQLAVMGAFGLSAVNMVVGTSFARLHARGDLDELQRVVTRSARLVFGFSGVVTLLFVVFGAPLLAAVFGAEYVGAYTPLVILLVGQFVNAVTGSVGYLLNMTGHERDTAKGVAIAALLNVLLNIILIPRWGMNGAAIATAVSLITWNLLLWRAVRIRLGINSFAFSRRSRNA